MFIESIELSDYRNYSHLHIDFHKGTNVLYGDNAQGKTNILEAVYVCSTTKSHRGSKDKEIIRFGADESHIKMMVRRDGIPYRIDMHLKKNKAKGVAASKIYQGKNYTDAAPYTYFSRNKEYIVMHPETKACLDKILLMLKEKGERKTFAYIRKLLKDGDY